MTKQHTTTTSDADRDYWRTPEKIYNWLNKRFTFDIDLACTVDNCRAPFGMYYDQGVNSLNMPWASYAKVGFCNPPYSDITPWLRKAIEERDKGFTSVFVIPMPNGEKRDSLILQADELIFITGRVAFIHASKNKPINGNTRGTVIAIYDKSVTKKVSNVFRDDIY